MAAMAHQISIIRVKIQIESQWPQKPGYHNTKHSILHAGKNDVKKPSQNYFLEHIKAMRDQMTQFGCKTPTVEFQLLSSEPATILPTWIWENTFKRYRLKRLKNYFLFCGECFRFWRKSNWTFELSQIYPQFNSVSLFFLLTETPKSGCARDLSSELLIVTARDTEKWQRVTVNLLFVQFIFIQRLFAQSISSNPNLM